MRILSIVGARPQFIKAAMFSKAVLNAAAAGAKISEELLHTGQHFDANMSSDLFRDLGIPAPAVNLAVSGGRHGEMTGAMLPKIENEIIERQPDVVVVYGDTNSTLAGALAAAKLNVPVAHIEAGMRHYRREIPEEINRVVTDHLCRYLFCSSEVSRGNLEAEGIVEGVHVTGDITFDVFRHFETEAVPSPYESPYVVCTVHRAANTDSEERLRGIVEGLGRCPHAVVLPLHPRTAKATAQFGVEFPANVEIIEPVSYQRMIGLIRGAEYVVTDSGGLQKDAFFCGKRVITMSEVSPWQELVDLDVDRLVGANPDAIETAYGWAAVPVSTEERPYGDGSSAVRMVEQLLA